MLCSACVTSKWTARWCLVSSVGRPGEGAEVRLGVDQSSMGLYSSAGVATDKFIKSLEVLWSSRKNVKTLNASLSLKKSRFHSTLILHIERLFLGLIELFPVVAHWGFRNQFRTSSTMTTSRILSSTLRAFSHPATRPVRHVRAFKTSSPFLDSAAATIPIRKPVGAFRGGYV